MKKFYLFLLCAAAVSFAVLSCSKEVDDPTVKEEVQNKEETDGSSEADDPTQTPVPEGYVRLSFSVTREGDAPASGKDKDTKTAWDGTSHTWSEGDQVRIMWNDGMDNVTSPTHTVDTDYKDVTVVNNKITVDVPSGKEYIYAVYPTSVAYKLNEGTLSVSFARNQAGTFAAANIMAAKAAVGADAIAFKNMTGILKFSLASESTITKVDFAANDKTVLNGMVSTDFGGTYTSTPGKNVDDSNIGNDKEIVSVSSTSGGNTYYLAVLPDLTLANGIGFKVTKSGSQDTGSLSTGSLTATRSTVKNLTKDTNIDALIHTDWFIKADGTGNGTSWEDAGGPARLVQLIYPTQSRGAGMGLTAAWRLHKATIHVAAGTYNIQDANGGDVLAPSYNTGTLTTTIKGGYPTGLSGTATTGYAPATNQTKFICNETATTDHVFELSGTNKVVDFTFDGITFTANPAPTETNIDGIAFSYTSSVASKVTFKNCIFTGLTGSTGTSNYNGGAAINFNSEAAATLLFEGCTFSSNTAARGGVAAFHNTGAGSDIKFKDCTFTNNIANGNQGGSVYVYANAAPIVFDNTSFAGDGTTNNASNGAAMCVIASASVTIQNGCSFSNLLTSGNGGAIFNHGTVVIDNSSISGCKANNGGAIYSDSSVEIRNGSTFTGNDATTNGGCIYNAKTLSIDASTITGKGKSTDMTALLGGGIYNTNAGTATLTNGSVIEGCAITGSSHHGAGICNAGVLNIDGCTIRNNKNTQRGAGIYGVNTKCDITVTNTLFSDNDAANGGAVALDDGASAFINGCTITGSDATNGSALRTATNSGTNVNKFVVFNTLIAENVSGSSSGNQNGATVQVTGYGSILLANCTICKNTTPNNTAALTVNGANGKIYVVSCTMSENEADIRRTSNLLEVHNSILTGLADNPLNVIIEKTYWYGHLYGASRSDKTDNVEFALGTFDSTKGVYPLNNTYLAVYGAGMSATDIQALTFDNITLTPEQTTLLAKDQKGNNRTGTIMGAYVLTE